MEGSKSGLNRYSLILCVIAFGLGGGTASWYFAGPKLPWPTLTSTEWAAWLQAIGSLATVMAAVGLARWERSVSRRENAEKELASKITRYRQANRAMQHFEKLIANQLEQAELAQREGRIFAVQPLALSKAVDKVERQAHLMPDAGRYCNTAIQAFERAQELIALARLTPLQQDEVTRELTEAKRSARTAISEIQNFLWSL